MDQKKLRRSNVYTMKRQKSRASNRAASNKHPRLIYRSGSSSKDLHELVKRRHKETINHERMSNSGDRFEKIEHQQ